MKKIQLLFSELLITTLLQAQLAESKQAIQQTVINLFDALSYRDAVN
jgi:hypothetical protein